jgi:hypothetical protein
MTITRNPSDFIDSTFFVIFEIVNPKYSHGNIFITLIPLYLQADDRKLVLHVKNAKSHLTSKNINILYANDL